MPAWQSLSTFFVIGPYKSISYAQLWIPKFVTVKRKWIELQDLLQLNPSVQILLNSHGNGLTP